MELESLLNKIFEISITCDGSDNYREVIEILNELTVFGENVSDVNLRQWILEYSNFWSKPANLSKDMDGFRDETSELLVGLNNQNSIDLEFEN